jgi:uncharacterized damage-inducible protein DinB
MDAQAATALSAGDGLPWIGITLDQTDKVAVLVHEGLAALRPTDPLGRFCFSLGELVMHIADSRRMFLGQLDGADYSGGYWAGTGGPDSQGVWRFRAPQSWEDVLVSVEWGGTKLREYLARPQHALWEPTEGTLAFFGRYLADLRAAGREEQALAYERRGPASLARTLTALACHEAGHRGALQTLLRLQGVNLPS